MLQITKSELQELKGLPPRRIAAVNVLRLELLSANNSNNGFYSHLPAVTSPFNISLQSHQSSNYKDVGLRLFGQHLS
jgi:hypothetical protein